ncbi:MAG: hypothetical protein ACMXYG_00690 [Candidatus Woesearchaeota archaeon]
MIFVDTTISIWIGFLPKSRNAAGRSIKFLSIIIDNANVRNGNPDRICVIIASIEYIPISIAFTFISIFPDIIADANSIVIELIIALHIPNLNAINIVMGVINSKPIEIDVNLL